MYYNKYGLSCDSGDNVVKRPITIKTIVANLALARWQVQYYNNFFIEK